MYSEIKACELKNLKNINIIDIREKYEYDASHIEGSINIPSMAIISNPGDFLDKNKTYYIICQSGGRSRGVCNILSSQGYDVINVYDGFYNY